MYMDLGISIHFIYSYYTQKLETALVITSVVTGLIAILGVTLALVM